jgi:hypothetical protein
MSRQEFQHSGMSVTSKTRVLSGASAAAFVLATWLVGTAAAVAAPPASDANWKIEIRPLEDSTAAVSGTVQAVAPQPGPELPASAASGALTPRMTYAQALAAVPFNREEYEANPSYRHDAAMEMMFGQLRPTMVVRQTIPYFSRYPDFFRNRFQIFPYSYQHPSLNMNMNYLWSTNAYTN